VYAPLLRDGYFPDNDHSAASNAVELAGSFTPQHVSVLHNLEASLPRGALQPKLRLPRPPTQLSYKQRQQAAVHADVEHMAALITASKAGGRAPSLLFPLSDHAPQPGESAGGKSGATPVAAAGYDQSSRIINTQQAADLSATTTALQQPWRDSAAVDAALILLQRLLRGRAAQLELFAGKAPRSALIHELRYGSLQQPTVHAADQGQQEDEAQQQLDAAIGAALCHQCCLNATAGAGAAGD